VERVVNQYEAQYLSRLERVGGFGGKADLLNAYFAETGNPDYFNEDLGRYKLISPGDIQAVTSTYIRPNNAVILSIVPLGKKDLAAPQQ
jgi:zinc protease